MKIDPNAPAMPYSIDFPPISEGDAMGGITHRPGYTINNPGLTIRAHMATQIMAGIVANERFIAGATYQGDHRLAAQNAVAAADLLIAELSK